MSQAQSAPNFEQSSFERYTSISAGPNQNICPGTQPANLSLSQYAGNVIKWQQSADNLFTQAIDITNTTGILTGVTIGNLYETTYFRAIIEVGDNIYVNSDYATISVYSGMSPDFGSASSFTMFTAIGAVGNTGTSSVNGNVGTNDGDISGFELPTVISGEFHEEDAVTQHAVADLLAAYNHLHHLVSTNSSHIPVFGSNEILNGGVYDVASAGSLSGILYLDAQGDSGKLFVFRFGGAFSSAAGARVELLNGALPQNIFWIAEGAISFAASTIMQGTLIANNGAVSMGTDCELYGSMYSTTGAISIYNSTITPLGGSGSGVLSESQKLCFGSSPQDIVLSGNVGNVMRWQKSSDESFGTFTNIASTSTTLTAATIGLPQLKTYYRAVIQNGLCSISYTQSSSVEIVEQTVAGNVSSSQIVCKAAIPTSLFLSGNTGKVIRWESSADATFATGIADIGCTATTLTSANIGAATITKYYRAVVQNWNCNIENSNVVSILVRPTLTYENGQWNGIVDSKSNAIIKSDMNLDVNLHVCSCQVTGTAVLNIPAGIALIVERDIVVDSLANIIIADKGSLVQVDDEGVAIGNISVKRNSTPMQQYDYSYWSAPVQNWKLNQFSPQTMPDKFFSYNPTIDNWQLENNGATAMSPGSGYIIRAPQGWSTSNETAGIFEGIFNGIPNTGIIPVTVTKGIGTYNLIGNPYPSAINVDLFLKDSLNSGVVNGTIYLWTHNTAISSTIPGYSLYNYTSDDYAKYNLTGGITTADESITGGIRPNGTIASGQGFFIEANNELATGNYNARFNNSMRVSEGNDQFYRNANPVQDSNQKSRLWLTMSNSQGAFSEALLGYVSGATNGFDRLYDGKTMPAGNALTLYTVSGTAMYAIQGRELPFNENESIPLGYENTVSGNFTIAINDADGLFENQQVYLTDHLLNTEQNLKTMPYTFATLAGVFNDRFELRFVDNTLGVNNPIAANQVIVYGNDSNLTISSGNALMEEVKIYDVSGRLLMQKKGIHAANTTFENRNNAVLIIHTLLENNVVVVKKTGMLNKE